MTKIKLDMEEFKQRCIALELQEAARLQAIREGRLPKPGPSGTFCVSDRH